MKTRYLMICAMCVLLAWPGAPARAEDADLGGTVAADTASVMSPEGDDPDAVVFDESEIGYSVDEDAHANRYLSLLTGYRFFSISGYGGRAATYEALHSGMVGGASFGSLGRHDKLTIDGVYSSLDDYTGNIVYDRDGIYRLHLRTESLYHNLDHLFLPADYTTAAAAPVQYLFRDRGAGDRYGLRVEQDTAELRYKVPEYPLHVNFGYWRMVKDGMTQLRFADQGFEAPASLPVNTIYSLSRKVDRQIHEGNLGVDANLGPVDVAYQFTIRQSGDSVATPADFFLDRTSPKLVIMQRLPGVQQHNEEPEGRYLAHTVKLHSSIAGGLVGAASYTYAQRENLSRLTDVSWAGPVRNNLHNVALDISYTPYPKLSVAMKYRHQEIDRTGPAAVTASFGVPGTLQVRAPLDTHKSLITATASYRPTREVTVKSEFRGEFLDRANLKEWNRPGEVESFDMASDYDQYKGIISVLVRPTRFSRVSGQYSYTTANRPDYGTVPLERHEGRIFASYNRTANWGVTGSYAIVAESNDQLKMATLDLVNTIVPPFLPVDYDTYRLPRHNRRNHATASVWYCPLSDLTLAASYGLLRSVTEQAVIFSGPVKGSNASSNYTSQAQLFAVNASYRHDELLDLSLGFQHIRSYARFSPDYISPRAGLDTAEISDVSRTSMVENAVSSRADYHVTKNLHCSVNYVYRDYRDKVLDAFSGTVHTVVAAVGGSW